MGGLAWDLRGPWSPGATVSPSSVPLNLSILEASSTCLGTQISPIFSQLLISLPPSPFLRQIIPMKETTAVFMKSVCPHAPSVRLPLNCWSSLSKVLMCKSLKTVWTESLTLNCVCLSLPASCHRCCGVSCAALTVCPHNHPPGQEKTKAKEKGNSF